MTISSKSVTGVLVNDPVLVSYIVLYVFSQNLDDIEKSKFEAILFFSILLFNDLGNDVVFGMAIIMYQTRKKGVCTKQDIAKEIAKAAVWISRVFGNQLDPSAYGTIFANSYLLFYKK